MATKIVMPKLGMAMKEGEIAKWVKQHGDPVKVEEPIVVVMSKKITFEVKASDPGVLHVISPPKAKKPVGAIIGWILQPGEAVPEGVDEIEEPPVIEVAAGTPAKAATTAPAPAAPAPAKDGFVLASPAARRLAKEKGIELAEVPGTGPQGRVTENDIERYLEQQAARQAAEPLATSSAKWLARERGLDLSQVPGSGPGGRVTEQDVKKFMTGAAPASPTPAATLPFTGMRQTIAEHMVNSLQQLAQVTVTTEIDVTELVKLRTQLKAEFSLTFTDLIIKAVAKALKLHPLLNSTLIGDEIQLLPEIHLGMAVALDEGLIVPVIRNVERKDLRTIAEDAQRLAAGARDGSLSIDEVTGSTFTVTNLGSYGADFFTPIINMPEVAILGVGRIIEKPAIFEGEITKRSLLALSLTIDHRVVDGAPGAAFLRELGNILSNPYRILIG
ncbi:MAG TPA: dihydrolipoamide acetyltransferase family protein [Anaerolineae bacterium]|nr:dihydrolipoamide acetyltransferase family protein [Anaerolineae bacterium]